LAPVAALIEAAGHKVFTPTIKGNGVEDAKTVGLSEAIESIADYVIQNDVEDMVLAGHRYGGMIITEAFINDADLDTADRAYRVLNPGPIRTLTDKISLKRNPAEPINTLGILACRRNSGCSGSSRCRVARSCAFRTRRGCARPEGRGPRLTCT
jgi:hypothetical protein